MPDHKKKRENPLFFSVSLLIAVAASAMLAVAGVAHVNAVEFAVHSVLIEFTIGNPAGNAAIDLFRHFRSSSFSILVFFSEKYTDTVDKKSSFI